MGQKPRGPLSPNRLGVMGLTEFDRAFRLDSVEARNMSSRSWTDLFFFGVLRKKMSPRFSLLSL